MSLVLGDFVSIVTDSVRIAQAGAEIKRMGNQAARSAAQRDQLKAANVRRIVESISKDHTEWEFSTINAQTTAQLGDNLKAAYDKLYDDVIDAVTVNDLDLIDYYKTHKPWYLYGPGQLVHVLGLRGTHDGNRVIIDQTKIQAAIVEFETKLTGAGFTAPSGNNQREVEEWWDLVN